MEIERKFIVNAPPCLDGIPFCEIEQAYISRSPVIRVRRRDEDYILTVKGKGFMVREEFELPLTREEYDALAKKADGRVIKKRRYLIPFGGHTIELDVFKDGLAPLMVAEVEFTSEGKAAEFTPPDWFGTEVTSDPRYTNAELSRAE